MLEIFPGFFSQIKSNILVPTKVVKKLSIAIAAGCNLAIFFIFFLKFDQSIKQYIEIYKSCLPSMAGEPETVTSGVSGYSFTNLATSQSL